MIGPQDDSTTSESILAKKLQVVQKLNDDYRRKNIDLALKQQETAEQYQLLYGAMLKQQSKSCSHNSKFRELEDSINEKDIKLAKSEDRIQSLLVQVEGAKKELGKQTAHYEQQLQLAQLETKGLAMEMNKFKISLHLMLNRNSFFGLVRAMDMQILVKDNWVSDNERQACSDLECQAKFSWFVRKHHCRKCGDIFCSQHLRLSLIDCNLIDEGIMAKVCLKCCMEDSLTPSQ